MANNINNANKLARREALRVLGHGVVAGAALSTVLGRSSVVRAEEKEKKDGLDCSKEGAIDKASKQMRKTLQYVEHSTKEGKVCSKCMQWIAPEKGKSCGGCKLFSGPVNPDGYCLSFAPSK